MGIEILPGDTGQADRFRNITASQLQKICKIGPIEALPRFAEGLCLITGGWILVQLSLEWPA
jgi:hypothetical protein